MIKKKAFIVSITWFVVYVMVTTILMIFKISETKITLPIQTLILTGILVPSIMFVIAPKVKPVSYTHLTLPTILRV